MKLKMTVDEALKRSKEILEGCTFHEDSTGWRAVLAVLTDEVKRLREEEAKQKPGYYWNLEDFIK